MAVASTNVCFSLFLPQIQSKSHLSSTSCLREQTHKRKASNMRTASSLSLSPPLNVEYLEREFSNNGVGFEEIGQSCVVKLSLNEGSTANLMLPSGLITSYKPQMWHGGCEEVLHTVVSEREEVSDSVVVQGGVSVGLNISMRGDADPWSPSGWFLHGVKGSPDNSIQIELRCSSTLESVDVRHMITLEKDLLSSEIVISNSGFSAIQLLSSFMSHLTVSTPDAVYAVGLQRSNYFNTSPLRSNFSIIPPHLDKQNWGEKALKGLFFGCDKKDDDHEPTTEDGEHEEDEEEEETDNFVHLTENISRIYTYAPRSFTIIDRGRRNSVIIGRSGFEEFHVFSPGSEHEWYGRYAFVCTGPSATLKPVSLGPQDVWRGSQVLYNPSS